MATPRLFDQLVAEGVAAPIHGWDFSWFDGRATEERPPWGYAQRMADRMSASDSALDLQTGGAEVLAEIGRRPRRLVATEGWRPNVVLACGRLHRIGGYLVEAPDAGPSPFADEAFDLVVARHPTVTPSREIARVLRPDGTFLSQQIGPGSQRELTEALMGPRPVSDHRSAQRAVVDATDVGLRVLDVQQATLQTVFFDIGAVIAFLRKVIWIVPGFDVDAYRGPLLQLHRLIEKEGGFVSRATRFLIEAVKT